MVTDTVRTPNHRRFAMTQEQAVEQERNYTIREYLVYLREGDLEAAHHRLRRGFKRQVRLSGLECHLREGENA